MADTTNVGNIEFDLTLDTKGLQQGAKRAETVMSRLDRTFQQLGNINQAGEMINRTGRALFDFGKQFIDSAAQIERFRAGLTSVTGSAEEAERQLERLREVAELPGLGFPEAVEGSTNLQAAGYSAEQAEQSLRAFGNALASVGKGKNELQGVILALSQMAAKGKLSAEEINQIAERVPQIRQVMKDAFGTAIPKDIEAMGISVNDFVSGVNQSLLRIPPVAQTASNAFENFGDTLDLLRTTIGNKFLPQVTQGTTDLTRAIKGLNEMLLPTGDRIESVAKRIASMSKSYQTANTETQTLISRYTEIKTALAEANIPTEESERLHKELLSVVKSLKSQLPALNGLWGEEGGAIGEANAALERRIELQKRLIRNEFTQELQKSSRALRMQNLEISRSEEEIDALQRTMNTFSQALGGDKLATFTFEMLENNTEAMKRFRAEMDRGETSAQRSTLALRELKKGMEFGATVGDILGGTIGEETAKIQRVTDGMADLSLQLENLIRVSGGDDVARFEQLVSTFSDLGNDAQLSDWNGQLEILATNLGLTKEVLTDFIRLASQAGDAVPTKKKGAGGTGGTGGAGGGSGKDTVSQWLFGLSYADVINDLRETGKGLDQEVQDIADKVAETWFLAGKDSRFELGPLQKIGFLAGQEGDVEALREDQRSGGLRVSRGRGRGDSIEDSRKKRVEGEEEAQDGIFKAQREGRKKADQWSTDQDNERRKEADKARKKKFRSEAKAAADAAKKDQALWENQLNREAQIEARFAANRQKGIEAEADFEQGVKEKGIKAIRKMEEDAAKEHERELRENAQRYADWAMDISMVADAFADLAGDLGASSELQQNLNDISDAIAGFSRLASGDIVGGTIQVGATVLDMLGAFDDMKLDEIKSKADTLWGMITKDMKESTFASVRDEALSLADALEELSTQGSIQKGNVLITDEKMLRQWLQSYVKEFDNLEAEFTRRQAQVRSKAQGIGQAVLEGVREGFSGASVDEAQETITDTIDKMLIDSIMQATAEDPEVTAAIDRLAKFLPKALKDNVISGGYEGSEVDLIKGMQEEIETASGLAIMSAQQQFNKLGIDAEKFFPQRGDADKGTSREVADIKQEREKEDRRTPGLSVAIRNVTTRQADTLTRVLRGQMSLMSQVAGNTLRSAVALEAYLPSINTNAERQAAIPAGYTTAPPASAPDRSDAQSMAGMGRAVGMMDTYLQRKAAAGG